MDPLQGIRPQHMTVALIDLLVDEANSSMPYCAANKRLILDAMAASRRCFLDSRAAVRL